MNDSDTTVGEVDAERPRCNRCGTDNLPDSNFCRGCSTPLFSAFNTDPSSAAVSVPQVPPHLSARLKDLRSILQDQRKLVTVMFADVRGSLEMIEGQDPETVASLLDSLVDRMVAGVHRYDGTVTQRLGDGIMALFGAPIADEAHAVRAAYAALSIHEAVDEISRSDEFPKGFEPKVRIGLNSGEVQIGAIRNDLTFDYRAYGVTTHKAARMEQSAAPGETRLSAKTVRLAEGLITVESLGLTEMKGVREPVEVFRLLGRTSRTRFEAQTLHGLSPFVGRDADMQAIMAAYSESCNGNSKTVVICGNAGIGKSRLCMEFIDRIASDDIVSLQASAFNYDWAPYAVISALLRSDLGISASDTVDAIETRIEENLQDWGLAESCRSVFESILNLRVSDPQWRELDPAQRRFRIQSGLRLWLAKLGKARPLVVVLDDLHWFDNESLAFLHYLIEHPPDSDMLLVLSHRPEFENPWEDRSNCESIRLDSLDAAGTRELITQLLGGADSLASLRSRLANWTQGNPFYIEETIRSLVEDATLVGEAGAYELAADDPKINLAPSIESVVAARIDRLDPYLKELVRTAAAIGAEVSVADLRSVIDVTQSDLADALDKVDRLGLMMPLHSSGTDVYRFKHAIVREVSYGSLLRGQRRELHQRILRALEHNYAERLSEKVDQLADHAFTAELWQDAAKYYMTACRSAAERSANKDAVRALNRGLDALDNLPPSDEVTQAGIDLRLRGLASLLYLGDKEKMFRLLHEAEYMARSIGDELRIGAVNSQLATALWVAAEHDRALEAGLLALELAKKHEKFALEKAALSNIACIHHIRANFEDVIRIQQGLIADFSGDLERKRFGWPGIPSVFCRAFLGSAYTFTGRFEEAVQVFEEGLRIADAIEHPVESVLQPIQFGARASGHANRIVAIDGDLLGGFGQRQDRLRDGTLQPHRDQNHTHHRDDQQRDGDPGELH